ncbi:hypothetical protein QBC38DRAFT_550368 [Podospora fimiseda]|uniref:Uncharacterized protein n=1 Tax=Podospora fimiseda TaxID=252190 RepID=A0AAN7BEF6_9PEZI|nr:hypothetical protein QBC38DRAFT_550368 [Podospora fimiseda]
MAQFQSKDPQDAKPQRIAIGIDIDTRRVTAQTFACPFSKSNLSAPANIWFRPMRTEDWTTIAGIVDHICSRHHPPISESTLGTPSPFDVTGVQALSSRGSEHSRWYKIWDVLFPDCPHPSSPFLIYEEHDSSDHRSETLSVCAAPRATPTNSGYTSAPALFDIHISAQDKGLSHESEDDLQTVYSAVTTVVPTTLRESILHDCETIHDQIKPRLNSPDFKTDSILIPWIIKIFAIGLGLEDPCSGAANWGIMNFVHKHHKQISSQLRRVLQDIDSDNDSNPGRHE